MAAIPGLSGTTISGTPKREQDFTLDQLGNWSSLTDKTNGTIDFVDTRTHSDANELLTSSQTEYTALDDAGNMTTVSDPRDFTDGYTLKYDAWNRLVEAKRSQTVVQENEYDGLNRRIVRDETGGSGVVTHFYYNRQWQVMEERVGSATTADKQYIYHPNYVDAVAVRYNASGDAHYYLQDANYNVTAVTDDAGTVKERYSYTPYGEVTVLDPNFAADADNKSDIGNEYLYTGRRVDPETYLQLNRNRFYHATMGRWITRDPIEYLGGSLNLYEYVSSRVLVGLDSNGLKRTVYVPSITDPDNPDDAEMRNCDRLCEEAERTGGEFRPCKDRCDLKTTIEDDDRGDCISNLVISGHGNSTCFSMGSRNNPDDCRICKEKDADESFGGTRKRFCKPCEIEIQACSFGNNRKLMKSIANKTGCKVCSYTGLCSAGKPMTGRKTCVNPAPRNPPFIMITGPPFF